jgi:hypothetical protein
MSNWDQNWQPRMDGWERLTKKIDAREESKRQETRIWAVAAMVLLVVTGWLTTADSTPSEFQNLQLPSLGTVRVSEGAAVEVPGMPVGIHYYWIVQ